MTDRGDQPHWGYLKKLGMQNDWGKIRLCWGLPWYVGSDGVSWGEKWEVKGELERSCCELMRGGGRHHHHQLYRADHYSGLP